MLEFRVLVENSSSNSGLEGGKLNPYQQGESSDSQSIELLSFSGISN